MNPGLGTIPSALPIGPHLLARISKVTPPCVTAPPSQSAFRSGVAATGNPGRSKDRLGRKVTTRRPAEPRAGGVRPRPLTDRFLRWLGRLAVDGFYRQIDVVGAENLPPSGPVIVLANHSNSLVDAAIITAFLPRMPRFLGASTVWDYRALRPFLTAAGVVPLYRRQDGRGDRGSLSDSIAKASGLLAAGGVLAIFPEGISHNHPRVLPLKSGAARIALETETQHGPLDIAILPVCLTFEAKYRVRSRALVEIGEQVSLTPAERATYRAGPRAQRVATVKALTRRLFDRLDAMTPGHATWEEARLVARAAEMLASTRPETVQPEALADIADGRRRIHEGYLWVMSTHPDRAARLRQDIADYDRQLRRSGLRDDQVAPGAKPSGSGALGVWRSLGLVVLLAPVAIIGLGLNLLPFWVLRVMSRRQDLDKRSTWSIFAGVFIFPAFWVVSALVVGVMAAAAWGALAGGLCGIVTALLALATGRPTLTFLDRCGCLIADMRARIILRGSSKQAGQLHHQRQQILDELTALAAAYDADAGPGRDDAMPER